MAEPQTEPGVEASLCFRALADQFARCWWMLSDAVARFPSEAWYVATASGMVPARRAYHIVYWADAYSRRSRFEVGDVPDPDEPGVRRLPDQRALLRYAEETAERLDSLLRGASARRLLRGYGPRRTGVNLFERLIYVLRHNMQHYGELQAMLRQMGLEPAEWR